MSARYSLKVTANVEMHSADGLSEERPTAPVPVLPESVQKVVQDELEDISNWYQYIIESMNMCTDDEEGMDTHSFCLTVTKTTPGSFDCNLEWISDAIDEEGVKILHDALDWFINDRMCFYQITNNDWHCYVNWSDLEISDA